MSIFPYFLPDNSRLVDQHFGHGLDMEDLMNSMASMASVPALSRHYYRPWRSLARSTSLHDTGSKIVMDSNKYQVCLDVQQFAPDEISVKTVGNQVVVEGKHEEKQDEHGYISRHFVRKYVLPEGHRSEDVVSTLSSDGVLSITVPKAVPVEQGERVVPIVSTGPAHKNIKPKEEHME